MKLYEIFDKKDQSFDEQLLKALINYTGMDYQTGAGRYGKHVLEQLLTHPKGKDFEYNGPMRRWVALDRGVPVKQILSRGGTASWSKGQFKDDYIQYHRNDPYPDSPRRMILMHQQGRGIDIQKIYQYLKQYHHRIPQEVHGFINDENEVIAPYYDNIQFLNP